MASRQTTREAPRADRVLDGLWRLRLPLSWPGIPHSNAYAIRAGDGLVLVDAGGHEPGMLEAAVADAGFTIRDVVLVACTHAHLDHCGAAPTVVARAGCPLWMHPAHHHVSLGEHDLSRDLAGRLEIARRGGADERGLAAYVDRRRSPPPEHTAAAPLAPDGDLVDGVRIETDLGPWTVVETPGHAPSHVCLYQPDRLLLIAGDAVLGRVAPYFDYGWTFDPVGEFLASLDRIDALDARLVLCGHGRPFTDLERRVAAHRAYIEERLEQVGGIVADGPVTAYGVGSRLFTDAWRKDTVPFYFAKALSYLRHLEVLDRVTRSDGSPELWSAT